MSPSRLSDWQPVEGELDAELAQEAMRAVHRGGAQAHQVHAAPEALLELAVGERRHVHLRHQIAAGELGQHACVKLVGLGCQRTDGLGLAGIGDLHDPTAAGQSLADPRGAAHHHGNLSARSLSVEGPRRLPIVAASPLAPETV
jgi:hypothetical protein